MAGIRLRHQDIQQELEGINKPENPLTVLSCINMPNAAIVWQNLVHDF